MFATVPVVLVALQRPARRESGNSPASTWAVAACVLLVVGCGSDAGPSQRAENIIAQAAPSPSDISRSSEDCTVETIIDEYGFEIELNSCDTGPTTAPASTSPESPTTTDGREITSLVPVDEIGTLAALTIDHFDSAHAFCDDAQAWSAAISQATVELQSLGAMVGDNRDSGNLRGWLDGDESTAFVEEIRDHVFFQAACPTRSTVGASTGDTAVALEASSRASAAYEQLRVEMRRSPTVDTSSDFWYSADQFGHAHNIVAADENFEIVFVGASPVKRGIDPDAVRESSGRAAINIAVGGLGPTGSGSWLRQAFDLGLAPDVVVFGAASFEFFQVCDDTRARAVADTAARRDNAFANVSALESVAGATRLTGQQDATTGPLGAHYDRQHPDSDTGRTEDIYEVRPDDRALHTTIYNAVFAEAAVCDEMFDAVEDTVRFAAEAGAEVYVVAMPLSSLLAEFHPLGRPGHDPVIDRLEERATQAGARFIDLTDLLDADQFYDLSHPTSEGREIVTDELLAALRLP